MSPKLTDDDLTRFATIADMVVSKHMSSHMGKDEREAADKRESQLLSRWLRSADRGEKTRFRGHVRIGTGRHPFVTGGSCPEVDGVLHAHVTLSGTSIAASHQVPYVLQEGGEKWMALSDQRSFGCKLELTPTKLALIIDAARRGVVFFSKAHVRVPTKDSSGNQRPNSPKFWERTSVVTTIDRVRTRGVPPGVKGICGDGPYPLTRWLRIIAESDIDPDAWRLVEGPCNSETIAPICDALPSLEEVLLKKGKTPIVADDEPALIEVIRARLAKGETVDVEELVSARETGLEDRL